MIKHIVLLTWSRSLTQKEANDVCNGFNELKDSIPEIITYIHGGDLQIYKGNADYALIAEFKDDKDLKSYVDNPKHIQFMKNIIKPILDSYKSIQFYA